MSDSYQAVYDAVRSRISNGDVGSAVSEVARQAFDISFAREGVVQEIYRVAAAFEQTALDMRTPSAVMRPRIFPDGNQWCALYGDDLASGVAGFGDTPADAMTAFDLAWLNERARGPIKASKLPS